MDEPVDVVPSVLLIGIVLLPGTSGPVQAVAIPMPLSVLDSKQEKYRKDQQLASCQFHAKETLAQARLFGSRPGSKYETARHVISIVRNLGSTLFAPPNSYPQEGKKA